MEKIATDSKQVQPTSDNYIRIAVVGNVDSGKSTIVGVLTKNFLDDGRGSARLRVFNYPHEASNGRTSSIAQEIMGFDENGKQIFAEHFVQSKNKYWSEVASQSRKIVALIDLCGHEKYLKTTMLGMVGLVPDYVMIVVGANLGLSKMTKEHLGIALALNIPFFIVMTKVDMVPEEITKQTIAQISKLLHTSVVNKRALVIDYKVPLGSLQKKQDESTPVKEPKPLNDNGLSDIPETKQNTNSKEKQGKITEPTKAKEEQVPQTELPSEEEEIIQKAVTMIKSERVCPIFLVSSTEGYGINELTRFMYLLKSRTHDSKSFGDPDAPAQFDIHERFVVNGVGLVVSGLLRAGTVRPGMQMILGPDKNNSYKQVVVKSIHFNRVPVEEGHAGQFCCLGLKSSKKKEDLDKRDFRKGMVLLDNTLMPQYCAGFEAEIAVLHHATTIKEGYECVMHCGVVRQSVRIVDMDKELLRTGDNGKLIFKFMFNNEFIKPDTPFLLREGRTKILGVITKVFPKLDETTKNEFTLSKEKPTS
jgi:GTPase